MAQLRGGSEIALDEFFHLETDKGRLAAPAVNFVLEVDLEKHCDKSGKLTILNKERFLETKREVIQQPRSCRPHLNGVCFE